MYKSITLIILNFFISAFATELTWDEFEKGYEFNVKYFQDIVEFKINGEIQDLDPKYSDKSRRQYGDFTLLKQHDSNNMFFKDRWLIQLINYNENTIKFSETDIVLSFIGKPLFPTTDNKKIISFSIKSICPAISEIIFNEVYNELQSSIKFHKAPTDKVTLETLYNKLKKDTLKYYMDTLPDSDIHFSECIEIYHLMRFIKDEKGSGFATRSFDLPDSIRHYIDNITSVINKFAKDYTLSDISILVIGYADGRSFDANLEPVAIPKQLVVGYDKHVCDKDEAKKISYDEANFTPINEISNNCQLSAARAKTVLEYLKNHINVKNITYRYAAGGIKGEAEDVPENRRVTIKISINAAKK